MSDMLYWLCTGPKEEDIWYNKCSGRNWIDRENIKEPHTLEVIMLLFIFIYYEFFFFGILLWNLIELWSIDVRLLNYCLQTKCEYYSSPDENKNGKTQGEKKQKKCWFLLRHKNWDGWEYERAKNIQWL